MRTLLLPSFIACILGSCATLQTARKDFLDTTDVSISANYNGVGVSDTITNGRRKVGVNVDAKQVKRAIDLR